MSWRTKRQLLIGGIVGLVVLIVLVLIGFKLLYRAPMCTDGVQNGGEQGIDCGGPCPYLCSAAEAPLRVQFVQAVSPASHRDDIIAYIDNLNANGGVQSAQYQLELYDNTQTLIAQKTGTITIPPGSTVPLYIPNVYNGDGVPAQAFLTIASSSVRWLRAAQKPVTPTPTSIQWTNDQSPHVTATLQNPLATPMYNVVVVATVFGASGNAIAASQTVVPTLPPQGTAPLIFTWNEPFSATPARVEILPSFGS